ncbi:Imidazole glycerol phosphate synthase subunit HisH [Legionella massiliensis]|uniref:Imidazole glycerol phosphate synthase subunit HisH n=1 Tax=Legionella massiliensis TaxID=1034943 RepID=A0A078L4N5_9GAMM|nr:imidazole glycerol phosphate synthase subunit HisH [Legionella massiliensis]CDZ79029.1 Imidazole glycerol phosphate synthase subunit HisH [Legionella massiliensis]CEE14767.1 Imidazole glycerol phosphate synthase subunit HisH [Legionella massiliensis]
MIAVIDITGNNLSSLTNAIQNLGYSYKLTHDPEELTKASHVILPGVGAAPAAMRALKVYQLADTLRALTQPILGICLGMQLLLEHSEEGDVACLGLIPGSVKRLPVLTEHPVPHMGWSKLIWTKETPLSQGLAEQDYVYFVHSYALLNKEQALASCQYSENFTAIVQQNNVYGMQFHPEKSAETGLTLLNNFLKLEER